ncbi:MAG TPA: methyltransferase domain-containing protein [Solirubrobacteraceae bacterium]|jgi:SAM-dependent methyltransferase|nr:methyltransferase domain-containing protein [Solirubrobacteraceae bacterium]
MADTVATHRAFMPAGTERFLDARSLADAHRRLAELLRPGMAVLDVGCGTGAITAGIAQAVGPDGRVLGVDVSESLIARARERCERTPNLTFELADVAALVGRARRFDVVTAARLLLWLADPRAALSAMAGVARAGGLVVVLDYNLRKTSWEPAPPDSVATFYEAFLQWRAQAGMDNEIADHLGALLEDVGLREVRSTPQHEVARRGEADFDVRIALWGQVIATRGHQVVADGFLGEARRAAAEAEFAQWAASTAQRQTLWLVAAEGVVPGA